MEQGTPNEVEGMTESQPLMRMRSANGDAPLQMKKEGWRRIIVAAVGLLLIFTVAVVKSAPSSHSTSSALDVEKLSFSFQTVSDYTTFEAGKAYPFISEKRFVEPQRSSRLTISAPSVETVSTCDWSVSLLEGGGVHDEFRGVEAAATFKPKGTWSGKSDDKIDVVFPSPGEWLVSVNCRYDSDVVSNDAILTDDVHHVSDVVSALYVRRELRALTLKDREDFLDSFLVLAQTPTALGREKYGSNFKSLTDFEIMHLRAASDRSLDHIHDGMGQLTQHISMTMEFELALQSVQPHLAVPFWDYTIDSAMVAQKYGKDDVSAIFRDGILFQEDFFGATDDTRHTVVDGRFGHLEVPRDYNFTTRSAYGFLRAPWNINPSKYVTRYHDLCGIRPGLSDLNWPTCSDHFKMTNTDDFDSWYDWVWEISYKPHGPVHTWIGGIGGDCHTFMSLAEDGLITRLAAETLITDSFLILKYAWREMLLEMPTYCASDVEAKDCMWTCNQPSGTLAKTLLASNHLADFPKETWEGNEAAIAQKVLCETPFWPGDHLEAASPIEASFWPVHPTLERLYQYRELARPFSAHTWEANTDEDKTKYCNAHGKGVGCEGHHPYDLTFWYSITKEIRKDYDGTGSKKVYVKKHLTNEEVRSSISPLASKSDASIDQLSSYSIPYIYEHFDWKHCADLGVVFKPV